MEKIFCMKRAHYKNSDEALKRILSDFFAIKNAQILRTENGKPYLADSSLFFSVSHTHDMLFIAFSSANVGLDAENLSRNVDFAPIVKKFTETEQKSIRSKKDFLKNFTAKESAVKFLGGKLACDFKKLEFLQGKIFYQNSTIPAFVQFLETNGYLLTVVSEKDFSNAIILHI